MSEKNYQSFERMLQSDEKLQAFNNTVPAGILVIGADDGRVVFSNRYFDETLGIGGANLLGLSWEDFFVDLDERQAMMIEFVENDEVRNFELRLKDRNGNVVWGLASMSSILISDEDLLLFAFTDVTKLKEAEERIRQLANYDTLTKLPTRRLFSDRLETAMLRADRAKTQLAVLFIDLDGFKAVNDTLGHEAGDEVLVNVSDRLRTYIRDPDTAARLGGDEFVVVLEDQHKQGAEIVGKRIVSTLGEKIATKSGDASIGASIGIAFYPDDGKDEAGLLKSADQAMYKVKKSGKGAVAFVSDVLQS